MSDRIVVMNNGRAEQVGTPFDVYNKPSTRFVANFVGTLNVIEGKVMDPAAGRVRVGSSEIFLGQKLAGASGDAVSLALRPEAVSVRPRDGREAVLDGSIADVSFLGSVIRIRASVGDSSILLDTFNNPDAPPPAVGDKVALAFAPADVLVLRD